MLAVKQTDTVLLVREIFQAVLGRQIVPEEDVSRANEPKWDSLKHVELMFALEERFDIEFSERELEELESMSRIISRITADHAP